MASLYDSQLSSIIRSALAAATTEDMTPEQYHALRIGLSNAAIFTANALKETDKSFDKAAFVAACGVGDPVREPQPIPEKLRTIILTGTKEACSLDPGEALSRHEESMTSREYKTASSFLNWVRAQGKTFGWGTLDDRWAEWQRAEGTVQS